MKNTKIGGTLKVTYRGAAITKIEIQIHQCRKFDVLRNVEIMKEFSQSVSDRQPKGKN